MITHASLAAALVMALVTPASPQIATRAATAPKWFSVRVSDAITLGALTSDNQGPGKFVVSVENNSELVRQYFNPKEITIDKPVPWQNVRVARLPLQLGTPDGGTIRVVLRNAVLEKSGAAATGSVAMETITITYEHVDP